MQNKVQYFTVMRGSQKEWTKHTFSIPTYKIFKKPWLKGSWNIVGMTLATSTDIDLM